MPDSMHDLREGRCGDEVEMHVVLPECLWIVYAGAVIDTREGFTDLSGTDWEIRERAGSRAIEGMVLEWRSGFCWVQFCT
jgi:hypothetical protein